MKDRAHLFIAFTVCLSTLWVGRAWGVDVDGSKARVRPESARFGLKVGQAMPGLPWKTWQIIPRGPFRAIPPQPGVGADFDTASASAFFGRPVPLADGKHAWV